MALVDNAWYVNYGDGSTTGYYAVAKWATGTVYAAGALIRQNAAPAVGSERVFVCVVAGTSHATTEPTWTLTRGAKNTDNTVTWQECTGIAALNGDATNTPSWTITATPPGGVKNTAVTLGQVIKRDSGASYQICTTAGTAGNGAEPAFSNTAGTTTADNTVTWTSLGVVGNFTGWQAPHARLQNSFAATWGRAGNKHYVASEHAETQSTTLTLGPQGTPASPSEVYCVTKTTLPPASGNLTTGATVTTTGNIALNVINDSATTRAVYIRGVAFQCGSGAVAPTMIVGGSTLPHMVVLDTCQLTFPATGSAVLALGSGGQSTQGGSRVKLINTPISFAATGQTIKGEGAGELLWENTASALVGAAVPTTLFSPSSGNGNQMRVILRGVDLSAAGAGKTLFGDAFRGQYVLAQDCKLGSSVTLAATLSSTGQLIDAIRCDSGATNYFHARRHYTGSQDQETTIVRTGGATDGTTPISWKIVTTANAKWIHPFVSQPITIWNDSTSAMTIVMYGNFTSVPNDDDIWMEIEYLGSSLTPQGLFATSTKADNLAASAATNNTSDGSTWGAGATTAFKITSPSFTPGMKGPINITIKAAKASSTFYIDPMPAISGVTVSKSEILAPGVYVNELSSGSSSMPRSRLQLGQ